MEDDFRVPRRGASRSGLLAALLLVLGACAPAAAPTLTPVGISSAGTGAADLWRTAELRDVRSGAALRVGNLAGSVVVIEPMAVWCVTCHIQQNEVRDALARLDDERIVYVSLGVDPNETEADLADYADDRGFPWHFAVASREVARSLAATFGDQVLSPPSTPKIVVSPDGEAKVSFGVKTAAALEAELAARLP